MSPNFTARRSSLRAAALVAGAAAATSIAPGPDAAAFEPPDTPELMVNYGGISRWEQTWFLADAARQADEWQTLGEKSWTDPNTGVTSTWEDFVQYEGPFTEDGWPTDDAFTPGSRWRLMSVVDNGGEGTPGGRWVLEWEGPEGVAVELHSMGNRLEPVAGEGNRWEYDIEPDVNDLTPVFTAGPAGERPTDLHLWLPDAEGELVNPAVVAKMKQLGVTAVRVMDLVKTNHSRQRSWDDRTEPGYLLQGMNMNPTWNEAVGKAKDETRGWLERKKVIDGLHDTNRQKAGVSWEACIDLANQLGAALYVCVPGEAEDGYVEELATLLDATLDGNVYLEYTNEYWNSVFDQSHYNAYQSKRLRKPFEQFREHAYGKRSAEIQQIVEGVLGDDRVVTVLGAQVGAGNNWNIDQAVKGFELAGGDLDGEAIGVTFYFHEGLSQFVYENGFQHLDDGPEREAAIETAFDELVRRMDDPNAGQWKKVSAHRKLAESKGARLIGYEGGSHIAPEQGWEPEGNTTANEPLVAFLKDLHRHPRIGDVTALNKQLSWDAGIREQFDFVLFGRWGRYGCWGHQPSVYLADTPRCEALGGWADGSH